MVVEPGKLRSSGIIRAAWALNDPISFAGAAWGVEPVGEAGEVEGQRGRRVAQGAAGELLDLVHPVHDGVAVDVQGLGRADQVETALAPGGDRGAEDRPVRLGAQ